MEANAGEVARAGRFVRKGMPVLADQVARFPKPPPRPMITEARKTS